VPDQLSPEDSAAYLEYVKSQVPGLDKLSTTDTIGYLKEQRPDLLGGLTLEGLGGSAQPLQMIASHPQSGLGGEYGISPQGAPPTLQAPQIDPATGRTQTAGPTMQPGDPGSGFYGAIQENFGDALWAAAATEGASIPISAGAAAAKYGPTLGKLVMSAWRASLAGAGGALGGLTSGRDPNKAALSQAGAQATGEALFGYGFPAAAKTVEGAADLGKPVLQKGANAALDWAKGTKGGAYAIAKRNLAVVENQSIAVKAALDDFAKLKGTAEQELALAGKAAVENIAGYGAPTGKFRIASDGAFERQSRSMYEAAASAAQAFERAAPMSEPFVPGMIDVTPISRTILRMERERPKTLRMGSSEFVLGDKGGPGPPMQSGELRAEAAVRGGQVNVAPGRPYLYGTPEQGIAQELNQPPADWLSLVRAAEGQRQANPSELMKAIGDATSRINDPATSDLARKGLEEFKRIGTGLLEKKLAGSPVGEAALEAFKQANQFYGAKQEFYQTAAWNLAKKNPENLVEMFRPRDPQGVNVLYDMAEKAGVPTLPKVVTRQLLDRIVGESPVGLADRMAEWNASSGQGIHSTMARLAQKDPELGKTWDRLGGIATKLQGIESMPGMKGEMLRDSLANLAVAGSAKGLVKSVLPASLYSAAGGAGAGVALHYGGYGAAMPAMAVAAYPVAKEALGYGITKLALSAAYSPARTLELSRALDGLIAGNPNASANLMRLAQALLPKDEKQRPVEPVASH